MLLTSWLNNLRQLSSRLRIRRRKGSRRWSKRLYAPQQLEVRTLLSATTFTPMAPLALTVDYTETAGDAAIRTNSGIAASTIPKTDDDSTGPVALGFTIQIGANSYSNLYINNNGNVTFTEPMNTYTPFGISDATMALLAPFFADVDTRGTGTVTYGQTTVDGHAAFGVTWHNVGYYNMKTDKLDDFQLVIVSRTDVGAGNFDFEFNYDGMQWETGEASGGTNGIGGTSARVGFAEGSGNKLEFVGSGVSGALLDGGTNSLAAYNFGSVVDGRFRFQVRDGSILSPLGLDNSSIAENTAVGTLIGTFEPFDVNTSNVYTYSLVAGNGDTNNASFTLVGDKLYSNTALNYEAQSNYSIRVRGVNQHTVGFDRILQVNVTNVNETPTNLAVSASSVAENMSVGTVVGTLSTTDPDASNTFTYTLVSGTGSTDNASFTISGNQLKTATSFNYESKTSYSIRIRTTDQGGLYFEKTLTINVTNVNETPTNITMTGGTVAENSAIGTAVGTFSSTDPDAANTFTYTLVTGTGSTDNSCFSFSGSTLQVNAAIDYDTKPTYSIRVRTTDQGGLYYEKTFTINATNVNETPTNISLSSSSVAENSATGTTVGSFSTTDPDASNTFTYTLVTGSGSTDNPSFTISGNQLQTAGAFDFETQSSYSILVRTTDQGGLYYEKTFTISVTNVNETPTGISLSNNTVAENISAGSAVGTFTTTDPDIWNTFTYTLVTGSGSTDNSYFTISGALLQVAGALDYDTKPTYNIRIRTTDQGGLYYEKTFTINATNVNETPTDISLSNSSVAENSTTGTAVGTLSTTDLDASNTFTYTLVTGTGSTDNAAFTISGTQLLTASSFDFETKSSYNIRVRTTDQGGLYYEKTFTIGVTNVNETPTDISLSNSSVAENSTTGTAVGTLSTTDPDASNTFTYTLVTGTGSTNNASFTISGIQLLAASSFDFETKSSYNIRVRTTDQGGLYYEKTFTIGVTNVNETPTNISLINDTVAESASAGSTVGSFSTTDVDASNTFAYTLVTGSGSTDNAYFTISGAQLQIANALDYDTQPTYNIRVRTTDQGGLYYEKTFTITTTNVNETPTNVSLSNNSIAENSPTGTAIGTFSTTDPDASNTFTYTLVAGTGSTDNASFTISGNQLKTAGPFDYETNSSYSIRVRTTDQGGLYYEKTFTIGVTDINETPTDISLSNDAVAESATVGSTVGTLSTTDPDASNTFTYTLVTGSGSTDNASFTISGAQLQIAGALDYDTQPTYSIRVRATDQGGLYYEKTFTITTTNVNETPTALSLSNSSVAENSATGTTVGTFSTTDPDASNSFTYTLVTGTGSTDNAYFTISGNQLKTAASFDFETKSSYSIRVRTTDQGNLYYEKTFTISITDLNETPTDLSLSNSSVAENSATGTIVGTLSTTDQDASNTFTYTLVTGTGSTDNAAFTISGNQLQTAALFDYETKSSYSIRIRATDQGNLYYEKTLTINVTDVNETPTDISLSNSSVAENAVAGTTVGTFTTTDQDASNTFTYTLVTGTGSADNASFIISGNQLKTAASFDFEAKSSYSIRVKTTDQDGLSIEKTFTISVTNVNETPTNMALSNSTVAENTAAGFTIGTFSTTDPDASNTFTYTLVSGSGATDNARFSISGNQLQVAGLLDYDAQPSYSIRVRTTDQGNLTYEKTFTINTTNVNEAPFNILLSNASVAENSPIGTLIGTLSSWDPDAGNTFTYSVESGTGSTDKAKFMIDGNQLRTTAAFDFETTSTYTVRVLTTDQDNLTYEKEFTISVTNVNETPTDIALSRDHVAENNTQAYVADLTTTDPDTGEVFTYSLVNGTGSNDNASFDISGGSLYALDTFNFEMRSSYSIRVRTTDHGGLSYEQSFTIRIDDVNETPFNLLLSNNTIAENSPTGTPIGTLSAWDPDFGDTFAYSLVSGTGANDNTRFAIVGNQLQVASNLDYDVQPSYSIRVRVTDRGSLTCEKTFTINATNVNESPFNIVVSGNTVAENSPIGTLVGSMTTWDPDFGDTFTYSLVSGTGSDDNSRFAVIGNQLKTAEIFDYDTRFAYSIRIRVTDSANNTYDVIMPVTITNVNESPFTILLSNNSVVENNVVGASLGSFTAWDPDFGDAFSYSLVNGAGSTDNASFAIVGNQLQAATVFDYETQATRSIRVRVTDNGNLSYEQAFTININNVNDAPIALSQYSFSVADAVRSSQVKKKLRDNVVVSVQDLINAAGSQSPIPSTNPATTGIAVTASDNANGTWQYSTDGGITWFSLAGTSTSSARLLGTDALLGFVPTKKTFFGTVSLTAVAWNQLMGTSGTPADATTRGGLTAFSTNSFQVNQVFLKT